MNDFNDQRRRFLTWAGHGMVLLSATTLGACGGGGEDAGSSGGGAVGGGGGGGGGGGSFGGGGAAAAGSPGTPVDVALRASTLNSVRTAVAGLASGGVSFNATTLAQALQALPALERVGISAQMGNVWAKFTDGQFLVVPNNLDPAAAVSGNSAPRAQRQTSALSATALQRKQAAAAGEFDTPAILTGQQYRQLDMLGQVPADGSPDAAHLCLDFVDASTLPNLRKMAVGRGFTLPAIQTTEPTDVGIDNGVVGLADVSGDGVFFITACAAQVGNDDTPRTVICTATPANEANLARHAADLASGLLVHAVTMRGVAGAWQPVDCLAIGPEFVSLRGWRFPTESIGIFNLTGGARLSDWIVPLNRAGLNHILGWGQAVSWQRLLAFADDLIQFNLATNNLEGRHVQQAHEPKLRSYGMGETLSHLISRGLTTGGAPFFLQEPTPALFVNTLLPTIDRALIREGRMEFELVGQFGHRADTGSVTSRIATAQAEGNAFSEPLLARAADAPLGGIDALRDPLWEGGLLQTVLDLDDLPRGGYVQVFNGGRCSNVVPITHWEIPFQVVTTIDALTLTVTVTARLRADVHGWRLEPDGQARVGAFIGAMESSVHSRADFTAGGTISRNDATTRTTTTITWGGNGSIANAIGSFFVSLGGMIDWSTRRLSAVALTVSGGGVHQQRTEVEQFDINGVRIRYTDVTADVPVALTVAGASLQGLIELAFDDQWALQAGQFDLLPVDSDILPAPPQLVRRTRVSWPQVRADFPPRPDYGGT